MLKPLLRILVAIAILSFNPGSTGYGAKLEEEKVIKSVNTYTASIALIKKYEGLQLKAYEDYSGCSIGYGTHAKNCSETITLQEAENRLILIVSSLVKKVKKDFPTLDTEAQSALVSFRYNCEKGYQYVKSKGLQRHSLWCKKAGGKVLGGLVKRRAEESKMIFD